MVSKEYLQLLDEVQLLEWKEDLEYSDSLNDEWEFFIEDWTWYAEEGKKEKHIFYLEVDLKNLAYIGYYLISQITGESIPTILSRAKELHAKKNAGYSGIDNPDPWHNLRVCERFGISAIDGCLTRICDKYVRYHNVLANANNEQVGETPDQMLIDFSSYCLMLICLLREETNEDTI